MDFPEGVRERRPLFHALALVRHPHRSHHCPKANPALLKAGGVWLTLESETLLAEVILKTHEALSSSGRCEGTALMGWEFSRHGQGNQIQEAGAALGGTRSDRD